jgi:alginate O-acetyltransferase complex protein AlgI
LRDGTIRFIQGLGKKVLVADALAPFVDSVFALPAAALDPGSAWLGLVAFSLQVYFDFSGYSDMAIGLARVLGFRLRENFNHPYLATSLTDFWRRWHISLSTWIKEYLYIPLGGNRVSPLRSYANLCICFVLVGLWHGAAWNFLIFGCFQGIALVAERAFWLRWQQRLPRLVNTGITLSWIMLSFVFFRCGTFKQATQFLAALGGRSATIQNTVVAQTDTLCIMLIGLAIVLAPLIHLRTQTAQADKRRVLALCGSFALLLLSIGRSSLSTFHPFLYFRF